MTFHARPMVEPNDGDDGGPGPSSWPAERRRQLRTWRRNHQCFEDPDRPGKRFNPSARCPHGTVGGHDNWGCQCRIKPGTERPPWIERTGDVITPEQMFWPRPGCEPAAVARAARRRAEKRKAQMISVVRPVTPGDPPATIILNPPRHARPARGKHRA